VKLSTRTRYGIRAILELAVNHGKGPLQTRVIARRQNISVKYLEQLMAMLKTGGFVRSIRGSKGGYVLARPPAQIKLREVFSALEGPVVTVECLEDEPSKDPWLRSNVSKTKTIATRSQIVSQGSFGPRFSRP
jgi:Rrf2 family protein